MKNRMTLGTVALCLTLLSTAAMARPEHHRKPPQEAFTVCAEASEGDAVALTLDNGDEITGTCQMHRDTLVAVPERNNDEKMERRGKKDGHHRRLPQAAMTACDDMSEGDYVTFEGKDGQMVEAQCTSKKSKLIAKPIDANIE